MRRGYKCNSHLTTLDLLPNNLNKSTAFPLFLLRGKTNKGHLVIEIGQEASTAVRNLNISEAKCKQIMKSESNKKPGLTMFEPSASFLVYSAFTG